MKPANSIEKVFFSREIYTIEALRLAAAVIGEKAKVSLSPSPGGMTAAVSGPAGSAGELCNEALNQQCRMDLGRKNSKIASIISTKALLSASGGKTSRGA